MAPQPQHDGPRLHCVASRPGVQPLKSLSSHPQSARTGQWSADGTCILHVTSDNYLETVVLPEDLLQNEEQHDLKPYSRFQSATPIYSTALYPHFTLGEPSTTLVLYAARDTPIQLRSALDLDHGIYATYSWTNQYTEAFIAPKSMVFTADASHFVAGSVSEFAIHDVNRPSAAAVRLRKTSKSRYATKTFGPDPTSSSTPPNSIITAMDINTSDDVLAIGSNTRNVALYADHGMGDLITCWKLPASVSGEHSSKRGVTQVKWSPDGTYLFVAERQSDTIEVYDIRQSCKQLSYLSGRKGLVNYQMFFDVVPTVHGLEVWAGGTDGFVRMWSNPEQQEGEMLCSQQWRAHEDPACAALVHGSGSAIATLSTQDRHSARNGPGSVPSESFSSSLNSSSAEDTDTSDDDASSDSAPESSTGSRTSSRTREPYDTDSMLKLWSIT